MNVGTIKIDNNKKCRQITGKFDHHVDMAVRCKVHHSMKYIPGFTRSYWMPPLGKCSHRIAVAASWLTISVENTKH